VKAPEVSDNGGKVQPELAQLFSQNRFNIATHHFIRHLKIRLHYQSSLQNLKMFNKVMHCNADMILREE